MSEVAAAHSSQDIVRSPTTFCWISFSSDLRWKETERLKIASVSEGAFFRINRSKIEEEIADLKQQIEKVERPTHEVQESIDKSNKLHEQVTKSLQASPVVSGHRTHPNNARR
jgi:septal ring factor EnvC (AmiA/AmiB activator)